MYSSVHSGSNWPGNTQQLARLISAAWSKRLGSPIGCRQKSPAVKLTREAAQGRDRLPFTPPAADEELQRCGRRAVPVRINGKAYRTGTATLHGLRRHPCLSIRRWSDAHSQAAGDFFTELHVPISRRRGVVAGNEQNSQTLVSCHPRHRKNLRFRQGDPGVSEWRSCGKIAASSNPTDSCCHLAINSHVRSEPPGWEHQPHILRLRLIV